MSIETARDASGRFYIAYSKGCSMFFRDAVEVRKWIKLPKGTASRESFDSWIASLADFDKEKGAQQDPLMLPVAGSFDPLHQAIEEDDPVTSTKMVI